MEQNPLQILDLFNVNFMRIHLQRFKHEKQTYKSLKQAEIFKNERLHRKAIKIYKDICQLHEHDVILLYNLMMCYLIENHMNETFACLDQLLRRSNKDFIHQNKLYSFKARLLIREQRYEEALDYININVRHKTEFMQLLVLKCQVLLIQERFHKVFNLTKLFLQKNLISNEETAAYVSLYKGLANLHLTFYQEAHTLFKEALYFEGTTLQANISIAYMYYSQDNDVKCLLHLDNAQTCIHNYQLIDQYPPTNYAPWKDLLTKIYDIIESCLFIKTTLTKKIWEREINDEFENLKNKSFLIVDKWFRYFYSGHLRWSQDQSVQLAFTKQKQHLLHFEKKADKMQNLGSMMNIESMMSLQSDINLKDYDSAYTQYARGMHWVLANYFLYHRRSSLQRSDQDEETIQACLIAREVRQYSLAILGELPVYGGLIRDLSIFILALKKVLGRNMSLHSIFLHQTSLESDDSQTICQGILKSVLKVTDRRSKFSVQKEDCSGWKINPNVPEDIWESFQGVIYKLEQAAIENDVHLFLTQPGRLALRECCLVIAYLHKHVDKHIDTIHETSLPQFLEYILLNDHHFEPLQDNETNHLFHVDTMYAYQNALISSLENSFKADTPKTCHCSCSIQ